VKLYELSRYPTISVCGVRFARYTAAMTRMMRGAVCLAWALLALVVVSCQPGQFGGLGNAMCPYLAQGDLANARISADARANAKIRAFLMAARDLNGVSMQMEGEATTACRNMGHDLGLSDAQMAPRSSDPGASAQAACNAVSLQIDGILRQGVQIRVQATP